MSKADMLGPIKGSGPTIPLSEAPLNTLIRVDRSIRPVYPDWVKTVMHPELENTGAVIYDLSSIELWLHDWQEKGDYIQADKIYTYLKKEKMLESCLSLRDGEEIQKKGPVVFQNFFQSRRIFLWKSVVQNHADKFLVPFYVVMWAGNVKLNWFFLDDVQSLKHPALRFVGE